MMLRYFKNSKEMLWMAIMLLSSISYCLLVNTSLFISSVLLSGITCVVLTAFGKKEGYIVGLYVSLSYAWISYENNLFGEVVLNLLFFFPTGIIGFLMWNKNMKGRIVKMRSLTVKLRFIILILSIFCIGLIGSLLSLIPSQNTPFIDAATNVLSVAATLLMMWRYKEQWIMYFLLNALTITMWVLRSLNDGYAGDTMIFMWILYLINSIFGYVNWHRGSQVITEVS